MGRWSRYHLASIGLIPDTIRHGVIYSNHTAVKVLGSDPSPQAYAVLVLAPHTEANTQTERAHAPDAVSSCPRALGLGAKCKGTPSKLLQVGQRVCSTSIQPQGTLRTSQAKVTVAPANGPPEWEAALGHWSRPRQAAVLSAAESCPSSRLRSSPCTAALSFLLSCPTQGRPSKVSLKTQPKTSHWYPAGSVASGAAQLTMLTLRRATVTGTDEVPRATWTHCRLSRNATHHLSCIPTDLPSRHNVGVGTAAWAASGPATSPVWILKSSRGTELATLPMWVSTSSGIPVAGHVMLLGSPSTLKKPDRERGSVHTGSVVASDPPGQPASPGLRGPWLPKLHCHSDSP